MMTDIVLGRENIILHYVSVLTRGLGSLQMLKEWHCINMNKPAEYNMDVMRGWRTGVQGL